MLAASSAERLELLEAQVRELDARLRSAAATDAAPDTAKLAGRVVDRVDALGDRVDTLSETARAAASGLVARERELASIRRDLDDGKARLESAISDFRQRVSPAPVDALHRSIDALADRLTGLEERQQELLGRLDALADAADADRSTLTSHERSLGELSSSLEVTGTRMDSVVATVRQAVESLLSQVGTEAPVPAGQPVAGRLETLAATVEALLADVESTATAAAERDKQLDARLDALVRRLDSLDGRPRLVRWGTRSSDDAERALAEAERSSPSAPPGAEAPSHEGSDLNPGEPRGDTRGPVVSFGGAT